MQGEEDLIWQHDRHTAANGNAPNYVGPFIIVAILFGIFGFLTSLNNVLVKKLEDTFQLSHGPAMLATAAWFLAYLIFSIPAAKVIEAVGYKRTMVISLLVMTGGALLFVPAANMVSFQHDAVCHLCAGDGRLRVADLGESLRFDSRARAQRAGKAHAGAGIQLHRLAGRSVGRRDLYSLRAPPTSMPRPPRTCCGGRTLPLPVRCCF